MKYLLSFAFIVFLQFENKAQITQLYTLSNNNVLGTYLLEDDQIYYLCITEADFASAIIDSLVIRTEDFTLYAEIALPDGRIFTGGYENYLSFSLFDNDPSDMELAINTSLDPNGDEQTVLILEADGDTEASFPDQHLLYSGLGNNIFNSVDGIPSAVYQGPNGARLRLVDSGYNLIVYSLPGNLYQPCCNPEPPGITCPEDLNGDGLVNVSDLMIFTAAFGMVCE